MTGRQSVTQPCSRRVIRLPGRYIVGDTPTNLEASVAIELPGQSKRQSIASQDNRDKTIFMPVAAVRYFKVAASLAIAEIEMPDLRRTLLNCSSVSLSRLRRILTWTLSFKFNELRKWVGFDLFMIFLLLGGMAKRALRRSSRDGDCPAPREDSAAVEATVHPDRRSAIPGNISARSGLGVLAAVAIEIPIAD